MLNDYGLPELRASPNTVGTSPANMMGSFADFDMTFAQSQDFGSNFDGVQPKIETGYADHRGSIGNKATPHVCNHNST